jgi:nitroreductase
VSAEERVPLEFFEYESEIMTERSRAFYEEVRRRRSVRDFDPRPVPAEVVEYALRAAGTAPSGANQQPWHFVVITDPSLKHRIRTQAEEIERGFYESRAPQDWLDAVAPLGTHAGKAFLEDAGVLIVVFLKKRVAGDDGLLTKTYYPVESVGIATGILITALHDAGLATLTYTPAPMRFLADMLERPDNERPFMILAAGYPADDATVPLAPKAPLDDIATFIPPRG